MVKVTKNMEGNEVTVSDEEWSKLIHGTNYRSPQEVQKFLEEQERQEEERKKMIRERAESLATSQFEFYKENPEREDYILKILEDIGDARFSMEQEDVMSEEDFRAVLRKAWDGGQTYAARLIAKVDREVHDKLADSREERRNQQK